MTRSAGTHALLRRIEDSPKPLVAAIHGNALGGGMEVAMSCHYRVAAKDAKVGQPEVLLGIIPGAGGTQRLPRLAGAELALTMCTDVKPVPASKAKSAGMLDAIIDGDLLLGAAKTPPRAWNPESPRHCVWRRCGQRRPEACRKMRESLAKSARGMKAPYAVVDAIEAGLKEGFDAGSVRERELFATCVVSTESKALRHLFFAEREVAKVPDVPKDTPVKEIKRAAVVGAGTMGGGIAMNYANAGIPVLLKEVDQAALDRGLATIRKNYEVTMSKARSHRTARKTLALIAPPLPQRFRSGGHRHRGGVREHDLKKATFAELKVTRPDCIWRRFLDARHRSVRAGQRPPAALLGHHYFSPANVMKLLEMVRARRPAKK